MTISLLVFQCTPAAAQVRPIISGSLYYANMNEPAIKLESKIEPAVSLGAFVKKDRLIGSLTTNRLASFVSTRDATSERTGAKMISRSKTISDTLSIGYAFNKFAPSILLSNIRINKKLEYQGQYISNKTTHTILKGISGTYFLDSNFSLSVFYVLPSQKINLEGAVGTGVNLIF